MKTTRKKNTKPALQRGLTFLPIGADSELERDSSHDETDFSRVADMVLANLQTVTVNDFYNLSKAYDLPASRIKDMFATWTARMTKAGRIKPMAGVYDDESFLVV